MLRCQSNAFSPTCPSRPSRPRPRLQESERDVHRARDVETPRSSSLLAPISEVAVNIATQACSFMLEKPLGGRGILLGGVPGAWPRRPCS